MGFWREVIGGPRDWARDLGLAAAIGLGMALIGPFGSYDAPLERRLISSLAYGVAGSAVMWPVVRLAHRLCLRGGLPDLFAMVVALTVAAVPVTLTVRLVGAMLNPDRRLPDPLMHGFAVWSVVLPFGIAVMLVLRALEARAPEMAVADVATEAVSVRPRILARLPGRLGEELLALQAEDHYVRVHTALGSDLVLMRLADAIAEVDGVAGLRVHRSWWVASAAVAGGRLEGRRGVLTLSNALEVPVTREATPEVRRAGWI